MIKLITIAAADCLAIIAINSPRKNKGLFFLSNPSMEIKLPYIKNKSLNHLTIHCISFKYTNIANKSFKQPLKNSRILAGIFNSDGDILDVFESK